MKDLHRIALTAVLLLAGCATTNWEQQVYPGPRKSAAEVARVEFPSEIDLLSVDGSSIPSPSLFSTARSKSIEVLPGIHRLVARYYAPFADGGEGLSTVHKGPQTTIDFAAEAGATYLLVYDLPEGRTGGEVQPRIVRAGSREAVPAAPYKAPVRPTAGTHLQMLQQTWEQADEGERAAFRTWLESR